MCNILQLCLLSYYILKPVTMITQKQLIILLLVLIQFTLAPAQVNDGISKKRAIRTEVPLTNSIQRAFKEGTRDFTGKPGTNYWQLETDYTINVSLNPRTQVLSGSETILVHNNSNSELS